MEFKLGKEWSWKGKLYCVRRDREKRKDTVRKGVGDSGWEGKEATIRGRAKVKKLEGGDEGMILVNGVEIEERRTDQGRLRGRERRGIDV